MKALEIAKSDIVKLIEEYNDAFKANDRKKTEEIEKDLREAEADYAEAKCAEVFAELKNAENPIRAAFIKHSYPVVAHKVVREDGIAKGIEIDENRMKTIALDKICKYLKIEGWKPEAEKLNQALAVRTALDLDLPKAKFRELCKTFAKDSTYMESLLKRIDSKETPVSDSALCKVLQGLIDKILFEDNGKKKNTVHALNRDIGYILKAYTKRGKKVLNIALAKQTFLNTLIVDVMHRIVTGKSYGLEYKLVTPEVTEAEKPVEVSNPEVNEVPETVVVEKTPEVAPKESTNEEKPE